MGSMVMGDASSVVSEGAPPCSSCGRGVDLTRLGVPAGGGGLGRPVSSLLVTVGKHSGARRTEPRDLGTLMNPACSAGGKLVVLYRRRVSF